MPRTKLIRVFLCLVFSFFLVSLGNGAQLSAEEKKAKHYERQLAYFNDERDQVALIDCKNIIQLDPEDANAYHLQASMHLKLGGRPDLRAAFGELSKGGEIHSSVQEAPLKFKGLCLFPQKPKKAKKHADIVLTSSPQDPKGHLLRGRSLIVEKEFEEGITELKKSLELDPDNEQIYIDLARAYLTMNKPEDAEASLEQGLQHNSTSTALMLAKGDLLLLQGKQPEAEAQFQRALELDADNDALYAKLGNIILRPKSGKKLKMSIRSLRIESPRVKCLRSY